MMDTDQGQDRGIRVDLPLFREEPLIPDEKSSGKLFDPPSLPDWELAAVNYCS